MRSLVAALAKANGKISVFLQSPPSVALSVQNGKMSFAVIYCQLPYMSVEAYRVWPNDLTS